MENAMGTKGIGERRYLSNLKFEEFVPSSGWTDDSKFHYLLVDLPGFKREEVRLQVDLSGYVTVRGERRVSENKYSCFEKTCKLPENSDMENITGRFEGEMLHVIVPKQTVEEVEEEPANENANPNGIEEENHEDEHGTTNGIKEEHDHEKPNYKDDDSKHGGGHGSHSKKEEKRETSAEREDVCEECGEKWGPKASLLDSVMKRLNKHRGIFITAALAFSLGVWVSRRFESGGQEGSPLT
ncbi:hypothetical protein L1049_028217 [Liquidambar formosana]|uniref:SHSP domain-containing protein n=1 Tax=Liquidambar formosana TaxID=63359 RepID=A0AAP0RK18_LIQFO